MKEITEKIDRANKQFHETKDLSFWMDCVEEVLRAIAAKVEALEKRELTPSEGFDSLKRDHEEKNYHQALPGHLGAVPPLEPKGQDEKMPTAGAGQLPPTLDQETKDLLKFDDWWPDFSKETRCHISIKPTIRSAFLGGANSRDPIVPKGFVPPGPSIADLMKPDPPVTWPDPNLKGLQPGYLQEPQQPFPISQTVPAKINVDCCAICGNPRSVAMPLAHVQCALLRYGGGRTMLSSHAGDCTIYASAMNGRAFDGICTCGYGWQQFTKGDRAQMYSEERKESDP